MRPPTGNPIAELIERQGAVVLDGGLATALEALGCDLNDALWSARVLMESPEIIERAHRDYLAAGADCITTASYQASFAGFSKRGLSGDEGVELLRLSVRLAVRARDAFWSDPANRRGRLRPLVAASVGPYGAYLADGSEYTGDYGIGEEELRAFHRRRWEVLAASPADLLACETIPSRREAGVLMQLLRETPGSWAWMSFSCRDGVNLSDGSRFGDAAAACDAEPRVAAVGVNCTAPEFIDSLIAEARAATRKPIAVYPNSGERYHPAGKTWDAESSGMDWGEAAARWAGLGAECIGGCCRVGPEQIAGMRRRLLGDYLRGH